ncbi:autophagy-related protein 18f-like isoform X3 [Primulina eburnea]
MVIREVREVRELSSCGWCAVGSLLCIIFHWFFRLDMKNECQRRGGVGVDMEALAPRSGMSNNGVISNSFKSLSSYLKFVSSGASTVAASVRSATSSVGERDSETNHDQVLWAGFDKLELERGITRQVLLLGYSHGFQVWDVEVADCVRNQVSRNDGPVSFMQMLPKPISSKQTADKFSDSRPLLIICADGSFTGDNNIPERSGILRNGSVQQCPGPIKSSCASTVVWFYSLRSQSYVHLLRFRSVVHLVRCSSRVVAVLQSAQVHCFDALKLERQYTILTNPVVTGCCGSGNKGFGPLAVGPRWMAYSGTQVEVSNFGRVTPQNLNPSASFPNPTQNGSLVAHYAKESSKQLAAGILTLGDMSYKKLSSYYSDLLLEDNSSQSGTSRVKVHGVANGFSHDADSVGMVIVRDIAKKTVIAQFRAHKSPILSLCFDPSGTLLATASVQGHNINVFRIMPGLSGESSGAASYAHLYRLQRGFTNAVIQDISFSSNSNWILISSSRGTSHLFVISPSGGLVSFQSADACRVKNNGSSLMSNTPVSGSSDSGLQMLTQQNICASGPPLTLSAVSRIRNGNNGWKNSVSGAAAASTGRISSLSGAIASAFHNCKGNEINVDSSSLKKNYHLLVFSPSGCLIQYALRISPALNGTTGLPINTTCESNLSSESRIVVEAMRKWDVCQKHNREERQDNIDMHGENGNSDSCKVFPERMEQKNTTVFSSIVDTATKQNISTEERHRMYICEAELQMHQIQNPLWVRSEIYFQSMSVDAINTNEVLGEGEIEIERVPMRVLESRPKDLVPVFDYLQTPKSQQGRGDINGHLPLSKNGTFICRSSSGAFDSVNTGKIVGNKVDKDVDQTGHGGLRLSTEKSWGVVNINNDSPSANSRLEIVNTRDHPENNNQLTPLNNLDCLKMENKLAESDQFD